jgi:hypothetical protein
MSYQMQPKIYEEENYGPLGDTGVGGKIKLHVF